MVTKAWLIALGTALTVAGFGTGSASGATDAPPQQAVRVQQVAQVQQVQQTQFGPLTAADRDFIGKVKQAGLWEMPAGQQAQERAASARVKEVGMLIMNEHATLDKITHDTAAQLNVELPNQPNKDQQGWLAEMDNARGAQWDQIFANRLRAAHGKVFSVIAAIRAGTRNSVVRTFAETANAFVMRHMNYLESTGLVDFAALPEPPDPSAAAAPAGGTQQLNVTAAANTASTMEFGGGDILVVLLLSVMAVVITLSVLWWIRSPERAGIGRRRVKESPSELFAERGFTEQSQLPDRR